MKINDISIRLQNSAVRIFNAEGYYVETGKAGNVLFDLGGELRVRLVGNEIVDVTSGHTYEISSPTLRKRLLAVLDNGTPSESVKMLMEGIEAWQNGNVHYVVEYDNASVGYECMQAFLDGAGYDVDGIPAADVQSIAEAYVDCFKHELF